MLYSLLRVGIFAVAFTVLLLVGFVPWLAAIVAAVIGLCVSYLFLARTRSAMSQQLYENRAANASAASDEEVEDR